MKAILVLMRTGFMVCDILCKAQGLIIDMDGVLWRDKQPLGDLPAIFKEIQRLGLTFMLATNNATLSVDQYVAKLNHFGVAINHSQIINSSQATAHYLRRLHPEGGVVFVVGEDGLVQELRLQGFYPGEEHPIAVVVGMDRNLTYQKLKIACLHIRSGVPFIATNTDKTYPTPQGLTPGAGSIVAALETATDISPTVIGKPSPEMYWLAMERMGSKPENTLVVGDRLETDIAGAQEIGCLSALVLSGVTSKEKALDWRPSPDCIAADLTSLIMQSS